MEADGDLAMQLMPAVVRLAREILAGSQAAGLTPGEMTVLSDAEACPGIMPGELAARQGIRRPSVTRTLNALRARGLISLEFRPADRRKVQVTITGEGRELLAKARKTAWLAARVTALPGEDQAALAAAVPVLDTLGRNADRTAPAVV